MAGLDLTGVRGVLDGLIFVGSLIAVTDDNGVVDDVLDDETGNLAPAGGTSLYSGTGLVQPVSTFGAGQVPDLGIAVTPTDTETTHRLLLPLTAPVGIRVGSQVRVLAVNSLMGDVQIVGRRFEVTEIPTTASVSVLRVAFLKPLKKPVTPDEED